MGGGLGDSGNARKKTFFSVDPFPNLIALHYMNMGSIRILILIEPSQLVLSNDPIVRHEPPIKPLQTRAPVHPHPKDVQF